VLEDEGQANNIISLFQHYTNNKLTPRFNNRYDEVFFSIEGGNDERVENIKVSKGEESCFIWCVFYSLLREIVNVLNIPERENRSTNRFDDLEYVFIDDPVSSLDENHLIELAVNIAETINSSKSESLKFIITTHNPLFYNIAYNELNLSKGTPPTYMLENKEDGLFEISEKKGDSNKSFSYHLFLKQTIKEAIDSDSIQKFHFTLLRNLYEKTANFLGYPQWSELLPEDKKLYHKRIIQFSSHSTLSNDAVAEPNPSEKQIVKFLFNDLIKKVYWTEEK
jgi:anticodon nuclease